MSNFPKEFTKQPEVLDQDLGSLGNEALKKLNLKGYDVALGLNEDYADAISVMARQLHIVEYCPKDKTQKRFASRDSAEEWLGKASGRAVFLFLKKIEDDHQLAGYAWSGYDQNLEMAEYPITSAYRLGVNALGRGLAADYIQTVVSATRALLTNESIGLETWQSNPALHIYKKLGFFVLKHSLKEWRPTLDLEAENGQVQDQRLYMGYPDNFLVDSN